MENSKRIHFQNVVRCDFCDETFFKIAKVKVYCSFQFNIDTRHLSFVICVLIFLLNPKMETYFDNIIIGFQCSFFI